MPARYTSERFVGRDEAFERLAARLDDAAGGRSRTMIVTGTSGVGVTRFLDEATVRMRALTQPMTVLRATAWIGGVDEPYGAIVRAIGPALRALPDDVLADRLGSGASEVVRLLPDLGERLESGGAWTGDRSVTAPERRQARTLESILGVLGPARRAQPGPARHRGPPPGRRREPGARHVPGPDLAGPAAGDRGHVPAGRRRARRPMAGRPGRDHDEPATTDPAATFCRSIATSSPR